MKRLVLGLASVLVFIFLSGFSSYSKITTEVIYQKIIGKSVGEGFRVWTFSKNEPRNITVIKSDYDGDNATIIIDIKTRSRRSKAGGKVRLNFEWIADEWYIIKIDNLTFK